MDLKGTDTVGERWDQSQRFGNESCNERVGTHGVLGLWPRAKGRKRMLELFPFRFVLLVGAVTDQKHRIHASDAYT